MGPILSGYGVGCSLIVVNCMLQVALCDLEPAGTGTNSRSCNLQLLLTYLLTYSMEQGPS